jgi:hypothetical protein
MALTTPPIVARALVLFGLLSLCTVFRSVASDGPEFAADSPGTPMDIVFLIDISGSTGGILTSVRDKFWELQNEMSRLSPKANYRLGIVCMGRPSFRKENNYIKVISDLTKDIDAAAFPFFEIKDVTAPGNYHLGYALEVAINEMSWSNDPKALKVIFAIGNGRAFSGPGCAKPIKQANELGIIIHSLYFMAYDNKVEQQEWRDLATACGGKYNPIELKEPPIHFEKPYDNDLLLEACRMINTTYTPYGPEGVKRLDMQQSLDEDAELQGENAFEARTFFKATELYQGHNDSWDLVDLYLNGDLHPSKISRKHPPGILAHMTDEELMLHVTEVSYNRGEYISIIKMLTTKREEYMKNMREKMMVYRFGKTFFGVMNRTMVEMAESKEYRHSF